MRAIKLDPRKLLGFKIVADGETAGVLCSPKIGGKGCPGIEAQAEPSRFATQSGNKTA